MTALGKDFSISLALHIGRLTPFCREGIASLGSEGPG
jgi:hypothetical protein